MSSAFVISIQIVWIAFGQAAVTPRFRFETCVSGVKRNANAQDLELRRAAAFASSECRSFSGDKSDTAFDLRAVKRLSVACPRKLRAMVPLALITGARFGEVLALEWEHCADGFLTFLETKNGQMGRPSHSPAIKAVLDAQPRVYRWVFTNPRGEHPKRYTVNGAAHAFSRAVERAGIATDDVTLHTLGHTALSRMIAGGFDDYTVMEISGHSSTRMLARYTHPTEARKIRADDASTAAEIAKL